MTCEVVLAVAIGTAELALVTCELVLVDASKRVSNLQPWKFRTGPYRPFVLPCVSLQL